jgi:hypothetical protein
VPTQTQVLKAEAAQVIARTSTPTLVTSLIAVDKMAGQEALRVRAWIIEALEERYPEASAAVEAAFEANEAAMIAAPDGADPADFDVDYVAVLIAALPADAL